MLRTLITIIAGTLIITALATPVVCTIIIAATGELPWPFSRVFDRVAMLAVVIMLIIYRKRISLDQLRVYFKPESKSRSVCIAVLGLILSAVSVLVVVPHLQSNGLLTVDSKSFEYVLKKGLKALGTGVVIGLIEESFFRVILLNHLRRMSGAIGGAVICSAIYAVVHFIAPVKTYQYGSYAPLAGFEYLTEISGRFMIPAVWLAIFGLFLVGLVLCTVMIRANSLALCIGLHAGWVFALKLLRYVSTYQVEDTAFTNMPKQYILVAQPIAWISVLVIGVLALILISKAKSFQSQSQPTS